MRQLWFAMILLAACGAGFAADPPTIVEIVFEGNEVTRPRVMQRELVVEVGDPADPQALERSRQALLDLGLFRRVHLREEPVEGGVRIVFAVDERYYILPSPRLDAKSDGRYAYGLQFRWNNVAGLNHTLRVFVEEEERRRTGIGRETSYVGSYSAPFVLRSPYSVAVSGSYLTRPVEEEGFEYTETFRAFGVGVSRVFSDGPASQGFTLGGGLSWTQQRTSGVLARPAYGEAIAPSASIGHRDFHDRVYSDVGRFWRLSTAFADEALGSDYSYVKLDGAYIYQIPIGRAEHQTLHLRAYSGAYFSGPEEIEEYSLGGASFLRGYDSSFLEGNAYYYVTAELARPFWKRWLRGVLIFEAGNVFAEPEDMDFGRVYTSLGIGLRVRFSHFVNFEVEAGYSIPLDGGSGRVFASRV